MSEKVIRISLDTRSIDKAIKEIEKYKLKLRDNIEECRRRIAEAISLEAQRNFNMANVDDTIMGGSRKANVTVSVNELGTMSIVIADGEDAVWCEFGSGVYHNGSAGSSPNPYGNNLGFTIGSYGKGFGKNKAWGYYDDNHNLVITRGTPASLPMYNAVQTVTRQVLQIVREVFK